MKRLLSIFLVLLLAMPAVAQQEEESKKSGPRKQLAVIVFSGLGGAVLGLSTLSFYGRPQDHLANIAIGFALGIIAGTSFVTYSAASNPQEFYGLMPPLENQIPQKEPLLVGYKWNF